MTPKKKNTVYKKHLIYPSKWRSPNKGLNNNRLINTYIKDLSSSIIVNIINNNIILDVGLMDESLFIDWVDFEWCWRAKSKGYKTAFIVTFDNK